MLMRPPIFCRSTRLRCMEAAKTTHAGHGRPGCRQLKATHTECDDGNSPHCSDVVAKNHGLLNSCRGAALQPTALRRLARAMRRAARKILSAAFSALFCFSSSAQTVQSRRRPRAGLLLCFPWFSLFCLPVLVSPQCALRCACLNFVMCTPDPDRTSAGARHPRRGHANCQVSSLLRGLLDIHARLPEHTASGPLFSPRLVIMLAQLARLGGV
jgi:hypothetical protein